MTPASRALLAAASTWLSACGGRTTLYGDATADAATRDAASLIDAGFDGMVLESGPCATPEGVRICGGDRHCPWLVPPGCRGQGCTPTGAGEDTGVCWTDLPDKGDRLCAACEDGEVCAFRGTSELICVPQDVCSTLWIAGDTTGCRYADKSDYTDAPLPSPSGSCPGNLGGKFALCGGDCGGCPSTPCVGRSPGRPFGICAWPDLLGPQGSISTCSVPPGAASCYDHSASCAVFSVAAHDAPEARQYGLCLPASVCADASRSLPGGLHCF